MNPMADNPMQLRIESQGGSPINEYRLQRDGLEFRVLTPEGAPYPDFSGDWRRLDDDEVELHHVLGTIVSQWLRAKRRPS